jgi:hypothetical protein
VTPETLRRRSPLRFSVLVLALLVDRLPAIGEEGGWDPAVAGLVTAVAAGAALLTMGRRPRAAR